MPTATDIILNDGQATPVAHTFTPQSVTPQRAVLVDRAGSGTTSAGHYELILSFSKAGNGRTTNRVGVRVNLPIEQTVDGRAEIAFTARFNGEFILPDDMTEAERDDIMAFVANAMAHADISDYVEELDPLY